MTPSAKLGLSVLVVAAVLTPILWFVSPSPLRPADATTPPSTAFTPAPSAGAPTVNPAAAAASAPAAAPTRPPGPAFPRILVFGANGPVTLADIPAGRFRDELLAVSAPARARALATLGALHVPLNNVASLHVDAEGALSFACAKSAGLAADDGLLPPRATAGSVDGFDVAVPIENPPVRHSKPGSARTIYLDFNGHIVTGTAWNSGADAQASYTCTPYDRDANTSSFSPAEQAGIVLIWERVAEAFRAFDVDVTTEPPAVFTNQTARVLITQERDAKGVRTPVSATASGVAYLNFFGAASFATTYNICFVYQTTLTDSQIARVAAHELGHQMGLSHDGTSAVEYYAGHGGGETSWGPIMGSATRNVIQWSKGEYFDANNPEDDLAIIAAKLTVRPDDHAGTDAAATPLIVNGAAVSHRGLLETTGDTDTFAFTTAGGPVALQIGALVNPTVLSNRTSLDVVAELRDASGTVIARSDPPDSPSASFSTTLPAGTYLLRVAGTGVATPLANQPSGYTAYGSIGAFAITGTVPAPAAPLAAAIVQEAENQTQFPGNSATFAVLARGNPATTFAWQRSTDGGTTWTGLADSATVAGAATAAVSIANLTVAMNGDRYRCLVSNSAGSATSAAAVLAVSTPAPPTLPSFGPFPIVSSFGRAIPAGTNQNLTASLTGGSDPLTLRWQLDGVDLPDADGPVYFLRNWQPANGGVYRVVATNPAGSVTSPGFTQFVSPEGGWQWRNPLPTGNGLTRAFFVNGRFLVGGIRGTLLTSTDGLNWTTRTLPAANNLFSFHFFNGLYVALGSLGAVFTSPDTLTWTPRNSGTVHRDAGSGLQDLALGDGRLVAVGIAGLTSTSTDGIHWTSGTAGTTEDLTGVAFAFDRFHAVSSVSGRIFSTADGVNWTSLTTPTAGMRRIAYGAGRLVAGGASGETLTSTNGTTWTGGSAATAEFLLGINFINGQFVAVGTGGAIRTSPDGLTWTARSASGNRTNLQNAAFGNGLYVIPGQSATLGRALLTSTDGITWRESIAGAGAIGVTLRGAAASSSALVAVGTSGSILHSTDGTRWTARASGTTTQLNDVAFGAGRFVAVGNAGTLLSSADGTTWSRQTAPATVTLNGVHFANGLWVIAASSGRIFTSANGLEWTQRYTGPTSTVFTRAAFGHGLFVAVGNAGALLTSPDGIAWTPAAGLTPENLNDVVFASGRFVAVGTGGTVLTSPDGAAWTDRRFSNDALTSVTAAFGQWIATGPGSTYYVSSDGATWTGRFTGTSDALLDCAVLGNELFIVGENSGILAAGAPIVSTPAPQAALAGAPVTLGATAAAAAFPLSYQWTKDGATLAGATSPVYAIPRTDAADNGIYRLIVTGPQGSTTGAPTTLTVATPAPGRIVNLSVRAVGGAGAQTLITGFAVGPGPAKNVLLRGIGPGLTSLGVPGALADPQLQLFNSTAPAALATNDNWGGGAALSALFTSVGAFPLDPAGRDAALQQSLPVGAYTAQASAATGANGVTLVELYDADSGSSPTPSRLTNVSARAQIGTGGDILIAGFTISGNVPRTVLVRGIGPALTAFGVAGALADPQLEVYQGSTLLYANDNWSASATSAATAALATTFTRVGAFALPASTTRDAVLLITLAPGSYTAQVSGVNGTTGVALVEVYELP